MMKKIFAFLFLASFALFSAPAGATASIAPPADLAKFDFHGVSVASVVQLIYSEALKEPYVIDPEVLSDQRAVSFRFDTSKGSLRGFVSSFLDSLGLTETHRGGIAFVTRKPAAAASEKELDVFVYRPRYRDGSYLVELLGPLFSGEFTAKRVVRGSITGDAPAQGANRSAPAGSAAASVDRQTDVLVFNGSPAEIVKLKKILPQVDQSPGDVLVRGVLYEVQSQRSSASAFGLAVNLLGGTVQLGTASTKVTGDTFAMIKTGSIDAVLSVLDTDSRFKAVSKPMLRVTSGGSGRFTVGQDVPVLGAITYPGSGAAPVQSVAYQASGVIFDVRPVIHDRSIDVVVMQQVSNFVSTSTGVAGSPTLIKRELKTDLNMSDGEVVVMGGLTDSKDSTGSSGPSFLPSFLRSDSSQKLGTEILLVLQVTKL